MGKKGNWFAILKRGFTSGSKDKAISLSQAPEITVSREKKRWGLGKTKHGENNAFIPLCREPSSIEKILGEAEIEQQQLQRAQLLHPRKALPYEIEHRPQPQLQQQHITPQLQPKKAQQSERDFQKHELHQPKAKKIQQFEREQKPALHQVPRVVQHSKIPVLKPTTSRNHLQVSAIKIQSAYRGYMARRNYRSLKALMRLQAMMRGQSVRRQTINTLKCMQMLVRVQSQIRARRMQMMESRALQQHHNAPGKNDKDFKSSFGKWIPNDQSTKGYHEWDDSVLTREEIEARIQRKVEAVMKRERALAYAYSHQLLKVTPEFTTMKGLGSSGAPLWWTSLDRQLPSSNIQPNSTTPLHNIYRPNTNMATPTRPTDNSIPRQHDVTKLATPVPSSRPKVRPQQRHNDNELRDDASLTSCPALTVPNYMIPTVSAKAKVRAHHNMVEPTKEKKKRFSFGLGQSIGSFFGPKENSTSVYSGSNRYHHRPTNSIGGTSVDSISSLPAGPIGRKYFQ